MARFAEYAPIIESLDDSAFDPGTLPDSRLRMAQHGDLSIYFAPFEAVNMHAKIVLLGITPGRQQMDLALREARRQLRRGASLAEAAILAKRHASFGGPMRRNLIRILDHAGIPARVGAACADEFFEDATLAHFTSCLRYPTFLRGENYNGTPDMVGTPLLCGCLLDYLAPELSAVSGALVVPLGLKPLATLQFLAQQGLFDPERMITGLPHPSPANNGRINKFLGIGRRDRMQIVDTSAPPKLSRVTKHREPSSSVLAEAIRSELDGHSALSVHPKGHSKYLNRYRTKLGRAVAHEHLHKGVQHLWVAAADVSLERFAEIAHVYYPAADLFRDSGTGSTLYGRHSGLRTMPELASSDLIRFSPETIEEARRIIEAVASSGITAVGRTGLGKLA